VDDLARAHAALKALDELATNAARVQSARDLPVDATVWAWALAPAAVLEDIRRIVRYGTRTDEEDKRTP
jgi:hypothetical protein